MDWTNEQLDSWRQQAYQSARSRALTHEQAEDAASEAVYNLLQADAGAIHHPDKYASTVIRNVVCDVTTYHGKRRDIEHSYTLPTGECDGTECGDRLDLRTDASRDSHERSCIDYMEALDVYDTLTPRKQSVVRAMVENLTSEHLYHHADIAASLTFYPDSVRRIVGEIRRHAAGMAGDDI